MLEEGSSITGAGIVSGCIGLKLLKFRRRQYMEGLGLRSAPGCAGDGQQQGEIYRESRLYLLLDWVRVESLMQEQYSIALVEHNGTEYNASRP